GSIFPRPTRASEPDAAVGGRRRRRFLLPNPASSLRSVFGFLRQTPATLVAGASSPGRRLPWASNSVPEDNRLGYMLFLGFNSSCFLPATSISMLKADSIYHTDDNMLYICGRKSSRRHIVAFSLDESVFIDFLPSSSRFNWPPPIWIRSKVEPMELVPERDWAQIPADLLLRIFGSLEIPDLLSATTVLFMSLPSG
ncbi:hypothetical protein EJB05_32159, partial [Eragrostis curvula]